MTRGSPPPRRRRASKEKSAGGSFVELIVIVMVALGLALAIQAFLDQAVQDPERVDGPGRSKIGQRVLVNRLGNRFGEPEIGEVVVFHPPAGSG